MSSLSMQMVEHHHAKRSEAMSTAMPSTLTPRPSPFIDSHESPARQLCGHHEEHEQPQRRPGRQRNRRNRPTNVARALTTLSLSMIGLAVLCSFKAMRFVLVHHFPYTTITTQSTIDESSAPPPPTTALTTTTLTQLQPRKSQQLQPQQKKKHPYKGAMDELGNWGYVHDSKVLKHRLHQSRNDSYSTTTFIHQEERSELCADAGFGPEGSGEIARQLFSGHIQVGSSSSSSSTTSSSPLQQSQQQQQTVRIMCAVYSHPGGRNQTIAIAQTWGRRCDGWMVSSTETIANEGIVRIPHMGTHQQQGKYDGLWQRIRSMLVYMYDNFRHEYDFFLLCGDDTYVIMENLREFLTNPNFISDAGGPTYPNPMYVGAPTHPFWKKEYGHKFYYNGGGAGYVINARTLELLVKDVLPVCHYKTLSPVEDLLMGECLRKHLNLTGYDGVRDELGREQFFVYDPVERAKVLSPDEARHKGKVIPTGQRHLGTFIRRQIKWLETFKGWTPKYGLDAISRKAISFHRVSPASKMRRYDRLLYRNPQLNHDDCGGSPKF